MISRLKTSKILAFAAGIFLFVAVGYFFVSGGLTESGQAFAASADSSDYNHLQNALSPYLQLHADNPVHWYPWGEAAFQKARRENKPIFLSVGYFTCYWCHVMERKVFAREDIARIMNKYFVSIKVDREQLPNVDRIYMTALQMMTGSGGWPMSMFLTPDLKPFFGATYIPPDEEAGGRGFQTLLRQVDKAWTQDRQQIIAQADRITDALRQNMALQATPTEVGPAVLDQGFRQFESRYDSAYGGFGQAPKFPRPAGPRFLMYYYRRTNKVEALQMSLHTLQAMARRGIHDHLGGGFHRYSTDAQWRVPHFEKMLYDQALLTQTYLQAYQLTGEQYYADVARDVLRFVDRDLLHPGGGFYSAIDAESLPKQGFQGHPEEGAYYVWTREEIDRILPPRQAKVFSYINGVKADGNALRDPRGEFQGENILYQAHSIDEAAKAFRLSREKIKALVAHSEQTLLQTRQLRPHPHKDDKIVLAWNGMMISAYANAYAALEEEHYREAAVRSAQFLLDNVYNPESGRLQRVYRNGQTREPGNLQDYAYFAGGLVDLYRATGNEKWLALAVQLTKTQIDLFYDRKNGGFYDTSGMDRSLLVRSKEFYGGALPGGNAMALTVLVELHSITGKAEYARLAEETLRYFGQRLQDRPISAPQILTAMEMQLKPLEITTSKNPC